MKNQKGVSLIALIITIIVIIILAAIVMSSGGNTISQANYASFAQQFGEYADQVKIDAATVMAETGKNGKTINNAQKFFMTANGFTDLGSGDEDGEVGAFGYQLPVGYVLPDPIKEVLGLTDDTTNTVVAYLITDQEINGYENKANLDFYGDSNGTEYHLVTSDGTVFTIPGFQEEQENGTVKYYITSQGDYYIVEGKTTEADHKEGQTVDGKTVIKLPVQAKDFTPLSGVDYESKPVTTSEVYAANLTFAE